MTELTCGAISVTFAVFVVIGTKMGLTAQVMIRAVIMSNPQVIVIFQELNPDDHQERLGAESD